MFQFPLPLAKANGFLERVYDVREKIVTKSSMHPGVSLFYQKLYK